VRRFGSAALDLCYVGAGRFDGYWELEIKPWDIAAGGLIAEEAGATVTDIQGDPDYMTPPCSILAASPIIYKEIIRKLV
jgi:myo-inositol-1(or 4)-monophosphatase